MSKNLPADSNVFWYLKNVEEKSLMQDLHAEVLVVGGGVAGLSAAQNFINKGCNVTLIEKSFCGAGASGKSSGFITPDSELGLQFFVKKYGAQEAKKIWQFVISGAELIKKNIQEFSIACDYQESDVLIVASRQGDFKALQEDDAIYKELSFASSLYNQAELPKILGSDKYYGAMRRPDTFSITTLKYCQAMKEILRQKGVVIYENTPALQINDNVVMTPYGKITAQRVVVCLDRYLLEVSNLGSLVYQVQTFLGISYPLPEKIINKIFPQGNLMVWDTDLIYTYYRPTVDNRLLIGGANYLYSFLGHEQHGSRMMQKQLRSYIKTKFGIEIDLQFMWPGLIGISKDVTPIADFDPNNNNVYCVTAATGLPWAAALGWHSAEKLINNDTQFDSYFSAQRKFAIGSLVQKIVGKRIAFSLSNLINLYFEN